MKILSQIHRGALSAILSGLFYGLLGYFGMSVLRENYSIPNMLFWRFLLASGFIGVFLFVGKEGLKGQWREAFKMFLWGMLFYTPSAMAFFQSSEYIGTGLASVLFFTFPVLVVLLNWAFFKTKITKIYSISVTLILIGMICLAELHELKFDLIGMIYGLISALFYALYILGSKETSLSPLLSTFIVCLGSAFGSLLIAVVQETLILPNHWGIWQDLLSVGILCTAVPILLLLDALKYISSIKASILSATEPISIVFFGVLLLGETLTPLQLVGVMVVLSGSLLSLVKNTPSLPSFTS